MAEEQGRAFLKIFEGVCILFIRLRCRFIKSPYATHVHLGGVINFAVLFINWVLIIHDLIDAKPVIYEHPILHNLFF
ncbi:hypothetical protein Taro_000790 [Colocasia esculenta]|uniref:Uncharacterized protein n=1 Tax=Colocasia esculenta TaxID=4460 RepID=A0A843TCZ9_COLES|nr:hypothetical protein [Colocasia esculenta]